jgi:hypothetical protein
MGGNKAMAVIGIGTTSRASVEDVLAVIATAEAKLASLGIEKTPSPQPSPARGEGAGRARCNSVPSPLVGEGQGEGEQPIKILAALDRPALNAILAETAQHAGLELVLLSLDKFRAAAHLCVTHSEKSMKQYGIPSVAEAAALAAAGPGAQLLLPRFCGRNTTASVAGLS